MELTTESGLTCTSFYLLVCVCLVVDETVRFDGGDNAGGIDANTRLGLYPAADTLRLTRTRTRLTGESKDNGCVLCFHVYDHAAAVACPCSVDSVCPSERRSLFKFDLRGIPRVI